MGIDDIIMRIIFAQLEHLPPTHACRRMPMQLEIMFESLAEIPSTCCSINLRIENEFTNSGPWTLDPKNPKSILNPRLSSIVLKIENEFNTQGLSTMLLCNKKLDEAGHLVMMDSQTITDNVWKIVDVNECFCKSMHVTRSQVRFMDWLNFCGKATESKSLLKIVQVRPVLAACSAEATPLAQYVKET
jgi:hypothetical protein